LGLFDLAVEFLTANVASLGVDDGGGAKNGGVAGREDIGKGCLASQSLVRGPADEDLGRLGAGATATGVCLGRLRPDCQHFWCGVLAEEPQARGDRPLTLDFVVKPNL